MPQYTLARLRAEYLSLWSQMRVLKIVAANRQAQRVVAHKDRYRAVEARTGVPWFVVGAIHMRESNGDFDTYLGNGEPLERITRLVPKGRGPFASFEDGAHDALVTVEHLDEIAAWGPEHVAYALEKFNGFGYRHPERNIPSPYLWGGTNVQRPGKFVADGVYDATVMDSQLGGMAVLRALMDLDPEARFRAAVKPSVPQPAADPEQPPPPPFPPLSPRASDRESDIKPPVKSTTIWGGIGGYLTTAVSMITALFDKLDNPYALAGLVCVLGLGGIFLYVIIRGRLNVQRVVAHLSEDDTEAA